MDKTNEHLDLRAAVKDFESPIIAASVFQLVTSIGLFAGARALMYWSLQVAYLLTLFLAVPTGALLVRVFIIQHDCGHGSFFVSRLANDLIGTMCSVLTLTPYANWRRQHAGHHAIWNNLDKRLSGADIYSACLTVEEYAALTPWRRFLHRLPRHPLVAHILIPPLVFLVLYRIPFDSPSSWRKERRAVYGTNLAIGLLIAVLGITIGFVPVLLVQLPTMIVTSIIGVWLFAVQHRFEGSVWNRQRRWSFASASMAGSSYLRLPKVLQWFTGNIGFHHIHHFSPGIPNYRLEACHRDTPALHEKSPLSFGAALKGLRLALWDEDRQRLVRFKDVAVQAAR